MRADRIEIEPFCELVVIDYKGLSAVNEHGEVKVTGDIPIEKMHEYMSQAKDITLVKIIAVEMNGNRHILIYGYLVECSIKKEGDVAVMDILVKTGTYQMDRSKHIRTFQNEDITFSEVLNHCNESYINSDVILISGKGQQIPEFIVQYQESDWKFVKRLASYLNTVVVPDMKTGGVKYFFGYPRFEKRKMSQITSYQISRDLEEYEYKKEHGISISEKECSYYIVSSREIYEIGNRIEFMEKELIIERIETEMRGGELFHTYYMKPEQGLCVWREYNSQMIGAGLLGTVKEVKGDKVKVRLELDENKRYAGYKWFAFSTVYSSPDGTGWYCMPEPGDTIRLCFPSEQPLDGYVSSAVHEYSKERNNPEIKFLKNRYGKEIYMAPDRIMLTNNEGTSIEISDRKGIIMKSAGSIALHANGKVSFMSKQSSVQLQAATRIRLKQNDSVVNIKDDITFEGMHIKLH
ncbi:hypothetical protein [Peptostreptococcus porci]|uniref:hypothetical protein n=1 Tax=Peptostreptococcus porci TaxID=2652282 RepID=UPI002A908C90|nr:hypothetical protein [Peptostreptococcus porci]MDY5435693.1 hypothetical protein [Peptostreptococcus porci]